MTNTIKTKIYSMTNEDFRVALHLYMNNRTYNSMYSSILNHYELSHAEFAEYVENN